jgi:hypothetical protein
VASLHAVAGFTTVASVPDFAGVRPLFSLLLLLSFLLLLAALAGGHAVILAVACCWRHCYCLLPCFFCVFAIAVIPAVAWVSRLYVSDVIPFLLALITFRGSNRAAEGVDARKGCVEAQNRALLMVRRP